MLLPLIGLSVGAIMVVDVGTLDEGKLFGAIFLHTLRSRILIVIIDKRVIRGAIHFLDLFKAFFFKFNTLFRVHICVTIRIQISFIPFLILLLVTFFGRPKTIFFCGAWTTPWTLLS